MRLDPALAVWLLALAAAVVLFRILPRWWKRKSSVHAKSEAEGVLRNALVEWLCQKQIAQAILEAGTFTGKQLQSTFELLPAMTEQQLRTAAALILRDRITRRVVASHMEKAHGTDPQVVRQALLLWSQAA